MMFAGYEEEPQIIYETCKDRTDVDWYGRFNFDEKVAEMYGKCNVMYSVYDADMENVRVALPNKLYEAVYCEMPLIVAKGTYLEEVVNEWGVGVAVDHRSAEELSLHGSAITDTWVMHFRRDSGRSSCYHCISSLSICLVIWRKTSLVTITLKI